MSMNRNQIQTLGDLPPNFDLSLKPIKMDALMAKKFSDVAWLVDKILPVGAIVGISGAPSSYKTWFILDMAIKVATGADFLDTFPTTSTGVLVVDEESGERWLQPRLAKLQKNYDLPMHFLSKTGFKLTERSGEELIQFSKLHKIGLLIFDSFVRIHKAKDENNAVEMAQVFSLFQKLTANNISVVFVHHSRKQGGFRRSNPAQDMRGSSDILAAVDCHISMERKKEHILVTQTKLRHAEELKPFKLGIDSTEDSFSFTFLGEVEASSSTKETFYDAIMVALEDQNAPMYKQQLFTLLKGGGVVGGRSTFKVALNELIEEGKIYTQRGAGNKMYCSNQPFETEGEQSGPLFDLDNPGVS
jgi:hypothetical protein